MKSDLQEHRTSSPPLLLGQQAEKTALPARYREVMKVAGAMGALTCQVTPRVHKEN